MASMQMQSPADVLAAFGPGVGLCGELKPFAGGRADLPLAQRLAEHPLLMAPMAGVTDSAYRMMARAGGADLAYSEMVSCAGLHYGGEKTWELVDVAPGEPDLAVQLFGTKPELFAEAAAGVAERLGVTTDYAQKYRKRLIDAGVIESAGWGRIRICVPLLADYLRGER